MYMKWDNALNIRWNGDERAIGKGNLKMGVIAVLLFAGLVGVLVLCSYSLPGWAAAWGTGAALLVLFAAWDPLHILKRRSRPDPDYDPASEPPVPSKRD